ncbi:MAG: glycosyltransferase [Bacteroidales bacterium]|jgi:spore maturation protein CgeB|nr:glycosyltransferase [Bacteroidales bacterium]
MSKVLIIGPNYFNFNQSVKRAFENLNWTVVVEGYDTPIHPFTTLLKWKRKFSPNREKLWTQQATKFNQFVAERFTEIAPNLVFVLNGEILFTETLDFFRKTAKVAVWTYDAISRFPKARKHIDHCDAMFCYEKQDVDDFSAQGKTAYFLPQACDETLYFLDPQSPEKDIDILFIGVLYNYQKRIELLKSVVKSFPNKKILIIGKYKPFEKNPLKWLFREKRNIYTNRNIPFEQVNAYYNRAKVVLNIHHETQTYGANPKVFEICGAGTYQICDANPFIETLFPNNEIGLYHNEKELITLIEEALKSVGFQKPNKFDKAATSARKIMFSEHTFTQRIAFMLNKLKI